jgi:hypothetical protein
MRARIVGRTTSLAIIFTTALIPASAQAWIFHEHAAIMTRAIRELPPEQRASLDRAWAEIRGDKTLYRLCTSSEPMLEIPGDDDSKWCLGLGALPALAGDHSCTPGDLADLVRNAAWVGDALKSAQEAGDDFHQAGGNIPARVDRLIAHNLELQIDDVEYRSRASAGEAHFQIPRVSEDLGLHLSRALSTGAKANAVASYANYHAAAISLAGRLSQKPELRTPQNLWAILLIESFAIHFLEDSFSAGHVVGAWGELAQRKGTHDYYSEHGMSGQLWGDNSFYYAHGDAFLAEEDEYRSSRAVKLSLGQVLEVLELGPAGDVMDRRPWYPDADVCTSNSVLLGLDGLAESEHLHEVLQLTLKPTTETPRFSPFNGEVGAFLAATLEGDADYSTSIHGSMRGIIGVGAGLALEGVTSRSHDMYYSLMLLGAALGGTEQEGPSIGFGANLHIPWAFIPGDGALWGPLALMDIVHEPFVRSAAGPWQLQRKIVLTQEIMFQFSLLRSIELLYYPDHHTAAGKSRRLELSTPVFTFQIARAYSAPMSSGFRAELGVRYIHLSTPGELEEHSFGVTLGIAAETRVYP